MKLNISLSTSNHDVTHLILVLVKQQKLKITLANAIKACEVLRSRDWVLDKELNDPAFALTYRQHYSDALTVYWRLTELDKKFPNKLQKIKGDEAIRILNDYAAYPHYEPDERTIKYAIEDSK